jgi:alpha-N-arabinofuranosidase
VLTAARVDAVNTFDAPNSVAPKPIDAAVRNGRVIVTLPAASITVLAVTP